MRITSENSFVTIPRHTRQSFQTRVLSPSPWQGGSQTPWGLSRTFSGPGLSLRACGSPMSIPWLPLWGQTIGRDAQVPWPLLDLPPHSWWGSVYGLPPIPLPLVPPLKKWQAWSRGPALEASSSSFPSAGNFQNGRNRSLQWGLRHAPDRARAQPTAPAPPGGVGL